MKRFLPIYPHQNTLFKLNAFMNKSGVRSHLMMKWNTCAPLMPPHSNQQQQQQHCTFTSSSSSSLLQSSFASIHQHCHSSSTNRPQQQQTTPSTTTNHTHLLNQSSSSSLLLSQSTIQQIRSYSTSITHDNSNNSNNHTFATTTTATTTLIQQQQQEQEEGENQLYMTDACSKRIHHLNEINGNMNRRLRVSVQYGGCSGYKVDFAFDDSEMDPLDDVLFEHDGSTIVVDVESLKYVKGSTVDYVETLGSSKFQMQSNPNADSKCSCGSSFNIII